MRVKTQLILLSEPVWMKICREIERKVEKKRLCDKRTGEWERNTICK